MKENNTYLITGASGFIGTHLVEELSKEGCPCICLDRRYPHKNICENRYMTTILGDLIDKQFIEKIIRNVDVCIHLASIINSKDKNEFNLVNIQGMSNIVDVSLKNKIKKFVYVSTCDIETNPYSLYAKTKLGA